jgi:tetratricopeptide (TPR) repeat protein
MASYVLEGFLQEALSDAPGAVEFRRKYVLYAVPLVDKDGVQNGDQGKGREPHDHNRDYGQTNLYPEVQAIQALVQSKNIPFVMDFHCPALRGDVHEIFYFDGVAVPHVLDNVNELGAWMTEELPPVYGRGPANYMKKPAATPLANGLPCAVYFAYQKDMILAVTLETPYTQPGCPLDAALARAYGRSLLNAWSRADFKTAAGERLGPVGTNVPLAAFRTEFQKLSKSKPDEVEQMANAFLNDPNAPAVYQLESHVLMGAMRLQQRKYAEAQGHCQAVKDDPRATMRQRATARVQLALIACADSNAAPARLDAALADFRAVPYASDEQKAQVYGAYCTFHQAHGDFRRALEFAQLQKQSVPRYATGNVLNTIAALYDQLQEKDKALAARQEAVSLLRAQLTQPQRSVFGAMMAGDLCIALYGIPTATPEEKKAALDQFMTHPVCPDWLKEKVRKALLAE